jgi:hypothetical protein
MLENPWVVGVAGGVLSGLIVTVITRYLFSKKDNREYAQKIEAVNREVLYALRPGISEGHIPTKDILDSLVNATARRYRVSREDVYRPKQIAEELIKEIMDSSFISSETKKSYCETLTHLVSDPTPLAEEADAIKVELRIAESEYRAKSAARMSATLGLSAAMITMVFMVTNIFDKGGSSPFSGIFNVALPTLAIVMATMVAMVTKLATSRMESSQKNKGQTRAVSGAQNES